MVNAQRGVLVAVPNCAERGHEITLGEEAARTGSEPGKSGAGRGIAAVDAPATSAKRATAETRLGIELIGALGLRDVVLVGQTLMVWHLFSRPFEVVCRFK